ncbi:hypothetical protein [Paenibacillus catalpae]|uniref:hypothetical protein n=1 Tax=Paenibacillus catalpae TaxID=1045775 RepID=UPI001586FE9A|nr:hypothetical protein [Paenibacillus catalpae]
MPLGFFVWKMEGADCCRGGLERVVQFRAADQKEDQRADQEQIKSRSRAKQ